MYIAMIVALVIALGGGLSAVAEQSSPGDALYSFKIQVNENVRAAFTPSPEGKIAWEARRAERRLEEAEDVAVGGTLRADVRVQLEDRFEAFADRVAARVEAFESQNNLRAAVDVISNFETALDAHAKILAALSLKADSPEERGEIGSLMSELDAEHQEATALRARLEAKLMAGADVRAAAEGKRGAAENHIAMVREFIVRTKDELSANATAQAEVRLASAAELIVQGQAKLEAGAYAEAFALFQRAFQTAREVKLLFEARGDLQLDVDLEGPEDDADERGEEREREDDGEERAERQVLPEIRVEGEGRNNLEVNL